MTAAHTPHAPVLFIMPSHDLRSLIHNGYTPQRRRRLTAKEGPMGARQSRLADAPAQGEEAKGGYVVVADNR